jgi:hypothetical protein
MKLQLERTPRILLNSAPYLLHRALVYGAACLCIILYLVVLAFIGLVFGPWAFWPLLALSLGLAGIPALTRWVGVDALALLRAGHAALITELGSGGAVPWGVPQTSWAKERVTLYFGDAGRAAEVEGFFHAAIKAAHRNLLNFEALLPSTALKGAPKFAAWAADRTISYTRSALMSHLFSTRNEEVFAGAKRAIAFYCQYAKDMLGQSLALVLLGYAFVLLTAVLFLAPLGVIAGFILPAWPIARFVLFLISFVLGMAVKWIFFDPFACTAISLAFLNETSGQSPDPEWETRVDVMAASLMPTDDTDTEHPIA